MAINLGDISRFKYLAHKVMPLVFDETLSYYEFLCKVIAKLNEVIDNENEQNTAIEQMSVNIDEWEEAAIQRYNEFTAAVDLAIEQFEQRVTESQESFEESMGDRANDFEDEITERQEDFEDEMRDAWDEFFQTYLQTLGVVQTTGTSTTDVMSQKAVTDELDTKVDYVTKQNKTLAEKLVAQENIGLAYVTPTEVKSLVDTAGGLDPDTGADRNAASVVSVMKRSDYIYLEKDTVIVYTRIRATNLGAICVYDTEKVYDAENSVVNLNTATSGTFVMPYNGYVRLSCRNNELENNSGFVIISYATNSMMTEISNITDDISDISDDITDIENDITALDTRVDNLENILSETWETYLTTKIPLIKSALVNIGENGESFIFVTDCHIPRNNMLTPKIIRKLDKTCPVNYHINGGDFIDVGTSSVQSGLDILWTWKDAMHGIKEYVIRGNHDNNNYNGENASNAISAGQFYAIMNRQIEDTVDTNGKTYFCIDNQSQKIRLIVLDNALENRTDMYTWFTTKLTELDNTWTILVLQHYLWGSTTDTLHGRGQEVINNINTVYSQINAKFIGILAGHTHLDYNATESTNGYLLIARTCNYGSGEGVDSLAFDYVTINKTNESINFERVGRGNNLSLSY